MRQICAWCGSDITPSDDQGGLTSHGICQSCHDAVIESTPVALEEFLERLEQPVILVDGDGVVSYLNRRAQELTGKTNEEARQKRGGDVFECVNATLPGGCGKTIHCSACAVRNSVEATYASGVALVSVPATLRRSDAVLALNVTTMKRGETVLLRIDRIEPVDPDPT